MRFHIASLPHTQTTKEYCWCAYTAKVRKFCNMMTSLGHEVFLYAGTQNEATVKELITVVSDEDRDKWFGHYDWDTMVFGDWNSNSDFWRIMNARVIAAIQERKQPGDFLGIIGGWCQNDIVKALPDMRAVEWGIGYEGILDNTFHVFESNAWMHYVYGIKRYELGRFFDTVIPNSFEAEDFTFDENKEDYLLYMGRLTPHKGLAVVEELAKLGHRIIAAGQGNIEIPGVEHVGVVRGEQKAKLLAKAKAVLVPTFYVEPFGGVAIEAMLSGTPVITTDFGVFTETVKEGVNGFRCHTIGEFNEAVSKSSYVDHRQIADEAEKYLTDQVRYKYETYFKRLQLLDGAGWYHNKEQIC